MAPGGYEEGRKEGREGRREEGREGSKHTIHAEDFFSDVTFVYLSAYLPTISH